MDKRHFQRTLLTSDQLQLVTRLFDGVPIHSGKARFLRICFKTEFIYIKFIYVII